MSDKRNDKKLKDLANAVLEADKAGTFNSDKFADNFEKAVRQSKEVQKRSK